MAKNIAKIANKKFQPVSKELKQSLPITGFSFTKLHYAFVFILAIILYFNTWQHDYAFDDAVAISSNKFTLQGIKGIPDLLTKDFFVGVYGQALELGGGRWRPLSVIMFALEYEVFGLNPHIGHIINILFYAITAIVLLATLQIMIPTKPLITLTTTFLFIAHPVHTEVVANIKSRDEILCFLALMASLYYLFNYVKTKQKKHIIISVLLYAISLTAKENGITFLFIIPLALSVFTSLQKNKIIKKVIPFFVVAIVWMVVRTALVGIIGDRTNPDIMENPFVRASFSEKQATIVYILGKYLGLVFFPHPLSSDYSYNQIPLITFLNSKFIISLCVYCALLYYAIVNIKKQNTIMFGIWFFIASISIISNILFNIGAPMGERFLYLPSLGIILATVTFAHQFYEKKHITNTLKLNPSWVVPTVIILVLFSYKTIARNNDWKNNLTLFAADVETVPNSAKARYYYGNELYLKMHKDPTNPEFLKYMRMAEVQTTKAVQINPLFHHAFYNLGLIYKELNQPDSAIKALETVLSMYPTHIKSQSAIGTLYGQYKKDYDKGIYYLNNAVKFTPEDAAAWENLGICYAMKNDFTNALNSFKRAKTLLPAEAKSYMNLAITYDRMGDKENAKINYEKAFAINPALNKK